MTVDFVRGANSSISDCSPTDLAGGEAGVDLMIGDCDRDEVGVRGLAMVHLVIGLRVGDFVHTHLHPVDLWLFVGVEELSDHYH